MALVTIPEGEELRLVKRVRPNPSPRSQPGFNFELPPEPIEIDVEAPAVVPQSSGRRGRSIRERAGPNARVRMRKAFRERQKDLKKALKLCERDLKSLTSTKKKTKKRGKKSTKKNAKKRARK